MLNTQVLDEGQNAIARINDTLSDLWTSIPAIIVSYNPEEMTVSAKPVIKMNRYRLDGTVENVELPVLLDVPVIFPSGGGCILTFPIKTGDECLVMFASRCIDNWWATGDISTQFTQRMHDLSDGFALVGVNSIPKVIPNISTNSVQLRTRTGTSFFELTESGDAKIKVGKLTIEGNIEATGTIKSNGKVIDDSHTHKNVQTGTGNSGSVN